MLKQEELGKRLKDAREKLGLTQQIVADTLKLPRTAITHIESGNRSISTLELTKLAELYYQPVTYFLEKEGNKEDLLVTLFREEPTLSPDGSVNKILNKYINWCREGYKLEKFLVLDQKNLLPSYYDSSPRNIQEAIEHGIYVADQERKRLELGYSPVSDIETLMNNQNIWAFEANFPENMSGLFLCDPSLGFAILINDTHVHTRKRFSYAHEYAHALLDRNSKITISKTDTSSELREKRANAFAANFLMPAEGIGKFLNTLDKGYPSKSDMIFFDVASNKEMNTSIRQDSKSQEITYQDVVLIANHFGVGYETATYQLRNSRYISKKESDELLIKSNLGKKYLEWLESFDRGINSKIGSRETEKKEERGGHLLKRMIRLTTEAYRRKEISRGKVSELSKLLGISENELIEFAEATNLS